MDEELEEFKNIFREIKDVIEKRAFVKDVLQDIVNNKDVDIEGSRDDAAKAVRETKEEGELQESKLEPPVRPGLKKVSSIGMANLAGKGKDELKQILKDKWPGVKNISQLNLSFLQELVMTDFNNLNEVNVRALEMVEEQRAGRVIKKVEKVPPVPTGEPTIVIPSAPVGRPVKKDTGKAPVEGKGMKKRRGRPRKQQTGKGMKKKRGRPRKEDKHLINSLVLHTGSKNAGNNGLDNDIKQIINRMYKNKMITATQKKELLKKYI